MRKIISNSKIKGHCKIEEIKKILYNSRNNLFKPEEDPYKLTRISNAFSSNYIEYKSNGDKGEIWSLKDYLDVIRPYLSHMINDHKTQGEWKIKLKMLFFSFFLLKILRKLVLCLVPVKTQKL